MIENFKPKFIIPIGISGSGKSRWIKSLVDLGYEIISPDDIRRELTGDVSNQSRNKDVFPIAFQRTIKAINDGNSVIFDATNVNSSHRKRMLDYIKQNTELDFDAFAKIFNVDPEICNERIRNDIETGIDRSNVPPNAVNKQYRNFIKDLNNVESDGYKIIS